MGPGSPEPTPSWGALDGLQEVFDLNWLQEPHVVNSLAQWRQADLVRGARLFWLSLLIRGSITLSDGPVVVGSSPHGRAGRERLGVPAL